MTDLPMSLLTDEQKKSFAERAALKRWGDPIDMVGPALMLAGESGRYVTGAVIVADGGTICRSF
jgi:NAD(P)-dependent dehydrogenase (short-subunit alcohol dehydrogenase family)